jgi:hypothetical protein
LNKEVAVNRIAVIPILITIFLSGCLVRPTDLPPTETQVPLEDLVAEALAATQDAEQALPPTFPYAPAEIALLVDPGEYLGGGWRTATVYDLTQPYPPLGKMCGGYYGGCGDFFPTIVSGVEVELIRAGDQLGEVAFIYAGSLDEIDRLYKWDYTRKVDVYQDPAANEIWLHFLDPYPRDQLGQNWYHEVGYLLYELPESTAEIRVERELLRVRIAVFQCRGYLTVEARFRPEHPWNSPEDNQVERRQEQEENFDLVYEFLQGILEKLTPYMCNP